MEVYLKSSVASIMILIASDFHLGYDYNTEREKDAYFVLDDILSNDSVDLIIFAGDLFDSRVPRLEVFSEGMHFLSKLKSKKGHGSVKLIESDKSINPRALEGIPFISVYGNHERRAELVNPVQALDKASLLVNLHCQKIVFEIDGKLIAIQGMSYVPEKYARTVLSQWNPRPVPGAINILLMHQNIEPFVYSDLEDVYLKISDLPQGFNYIINGHIHWHNEVKIGDGKLLMPGSTIPTQLNKKEAEFRKGYFTLDPNNGEAKFSEIKQRDFLFTQVDSVDEIKKILDNLKKKELKPIVKFRIRNASSIDLNLIEKNYSDKAIMVFQREVSKSFDKQKTEILRKQMSAEEYGMKLIREKSKLEFADELLEVILEEDIDGVERVLRKGLVQTAQVQEKAQKETTADIRNGANEGLSMKNFL